jgi:hypothetical protein
MTTFREKLFVRAMEWQEGWRKKRAGPGARSRSVAVERLSSRPALSRASGAAHAEKRHGRAGTTRAIAALFVRGRTIGNMRQTFHAPGTVTGQSGVRLGKISDDPA